MTCRTLHPDPQRLLTLGEAARAAGVSHLALRRSVQSGILPTLPALHLGQRIRLVEPAALLAAYPESACEGRPPLDPDHRGIEWIGASPEDEPPQGASPVVVPAREEPAYELPRADAAAPETVAASPRSLRPSSAQESAPRLHESTPNEAVPIRPDGLDGLVSAEFGGSARAAASSSTLTVRQPAAQGSSAAPLESQSIPRSRASQDTQQETGVAVETRASQALQHEAIPEQPAEGPTPSSPLSGAHAEEGPATELAGAAPAAPSAETPLTESVERWESGRRRRARMVQGALTAWAVLLVAAWMQFEDADQGPVQAAGWTGAGVDSRVDSSPEPRFVNGTAVRPMEASAPVPFQAPAAEAVEPALSTEGPSEVIEAQALAAVTPSGEEVSSAGTPAGVDASDPAAQAEGIQPQPAPAAEESMAAEAPEPAPAYSAHRETPRFAGAPCAWWEMTRPGGDLRRVLGPCKGPYDEDHGAIVGLHRQGSEHLCSHHLRFVRDLGGDLEAELASAAAARDGGLPGPLLAMRIDGAARSMVRDRVGRWVQSGFEGGDGHLLESLGGDSWRVRTWVVAALEGEEPRRMEVELVLTLGDGPHDDTLQSFRFPRAR